jgi:hypothetical protein
MSGEEYLRGRPQILGRTIQIPADDAPPPVAVPVHARSAGVSLSTAGSRPIRPA